jgi:hypothetical protein
MESYEVIREGLRRSYEECLGMRPSEELTSAELTELGESARRNSDVCLLERVENYRSLLEKSVEQE